MDIGILRHFITRAFAADIATFTAGRLPGIRITRCSLFGGEGTPEAGAIEVSSHVPSTIQAKLRGRYLAPPATSPVGRSRTELQGTRPPAFTTLEAGHLARQGQ